MRKIIYLKPIESESELKSLRSEGYTNVLRKKLNSILGIDCNNLDLLELAKIANRNLKQPRKESNINKRSAHKLIKRLCYEKNTHLKKEKKVKKSNKISSKDFYYSDEWRALRYKVLLKFGARCQCCGRNYKDHKVIIHVDHIKPRSKFPELELSESNLQILCEDCNLGKMAKDQTDWR